MSSNATSAVGSEAAAAVAAPSGLPPADSAVASADAFDKHLEWADVFEVSDDALILQPKVGRGQVHQITHEVAQDEQDPALFEVDGKDQSWFMQKGAVMFDCPDPANFQLQLKFLGGRQSCFGDDYAELSRAEQLAQVNWLLMAGVAPKSYQLTGYKDCKVSGFYFLLHLNYRRTAWRIIGCPHSNCEIEDMEGELHTSDPQDGNQFELPAYESQTISVEYSNGELWLLDNGERVCRGCWAHEDESLEEGKLPGKDYRPVVLTPNCKTHLRAEVV
eukprot:gnl/TRDRNA2_/TRDRNA2_191387_c0_seq1.p1 gnl/TRDRNA2_/TRDRNA2_191387_c0~~gnl/TRDRNA2_/TRDRNA2_191387_c0_seq1.p1  ORF type:complete len:284 (-),score=63.41 gnl/TRDRNA2_/TRDRNA2_191387_c0_seq1:30-854(-)